MIWRRLDFLALWVAATALSGCRPNASPPSASPPEALAQPSGGSHDGGALYATYCALCHGDRGQGYAADAAHALANPELLATATDAFLRDAITEGRPGTPMSAWGVAHGGPLSDPEVDAVVHYLRAWQTTPAVALSDAPVRGSALRGQAVYDANCAACHGPEAAGGVAVGLANPRFLASASDQFLRYAIEHGRTGTPMPGWGGVLRRQQIDDVVVYLRSLARAPGELPEAAAELDLTGALLNPSGGAASFELREGRFVAADDVKAALDAGARLVVLDARARSDFAAGHIAGAANLPFYESAGHLDSLPRDAWVVTYCGCPHAVSGQLADALIAAGFPHVAVLDEGYFVWRQRGYPVVEPTFTRPEGR
ncbi:MAG: c-type cytochrome [Myxococcales bacterium]|nr:c-type cytochrome [Myxococcales bacterium]MCB9519861.1 c-type cytochrome [Myxococcales bacterium]MCB9532305.1 c-type cytochrome [Myxococcales bacterium]